MFVSLFGVEAVAVSALLL